MCIRDRPRVRDGFAREQLDDARLAGTVIPRERKAHALPHLERKPFKYGRAPIADGKLPYQMCIRDRS